MINQLDFNGGIVQSACSIGSILYIGGTFNSGNGQVRSNFAAVDTITGNLLPLAPMFDGTIYALEACGTKLAIGGSFLNVNGQSSQAFAIYDTVGATFQSGLTSTGYSFVSITISTIIYSLAYHTANDIVYFGGQFQIYDGTTTLGQLSALNLTSHTIQSFDLGFTLNFSSQGVIVATAGKSLSIDQVNHRLYAICGPSPNALRSFDITTPSSISIFTWAPTSSGSGAIKIFYYSSLVYVSSGTGPSSGPINGVVRGLIATNAVTGSNDITQDVSISKGSFQADARVLSVIRSGNLLYVAGHFDQVKTPSISVRSCFALFDLGNNANILGENIDMRSFVLINYVTPFQALEPASVQTMYLDGDKMHLFGNFSAIDGIIWTKGHYILNANGKRTQNIFSF